MNVLVIGLGSMGKRRIRLMREMYPEFRIYGLDGREDRKKETSDRFGIECVSTVEEAALRFEIDAAFICTSPLSHSELITGCLMHKWHVFTEINLVADGYEKNMKLARENGCKLFLSSTNLYAEEIRYITDKVDTEKKWNYIFHVGQYLPDWHPWENYKDFFVGNSRTNGCREILAIELPWIAMAFGDIDTVHAISDKITDLEIDYHDNYMIQIRHKNGNKGSFIADVVSPVAVRKLEAYAEGNYMRWDGTPETLYVYNKENDKLENVMLNENAEHQEGYRDIVVENDYKNEIREFFNVIINGKTPVYGFEQDMELLKLIDSMEVIS